MSKTNTSSEKKEITFEELKTKFIKLKAIHDSTNEFMIKLQEDNKQLRSKLESAEKQLEQNDSQLLVQKTVTQKSIESANKQNESCLQEIERLRAEIRRMKNDSNHRLGNKSDSCSER